jgi:hypothetical protein
VRRFRVLPLARSRRYTHSLAALPSQSGPLPQQVLRAFNGSSKVRAAKICEHRKSYANHFSLAVEERSARTPGGCGGVVDNLVPKHVADMALRGRGADESL